MKKIIIDTNFLMIPYKFRVDIFLEFRRICNFNYNLFAYDKSIDELNSIIEKQSGNNKRAAKFALKLIEIKKIGIIKSENKDAGAYVDSLMLGNFGENTVIATQDMELKRRLLEKGISVIILRQKKYLEITEKSGSIQKIG